MVNWERIVRKFKALRGMEDKEEMAVPEVVAVDSEALTEKSVRDIKEMVEGLLKKMNPSWIDEAIDM